MISLTVQYRTPINSTLISFCS